MTEITPDMMLARIQRYTRKGRRRAMQVIKRGNAGLDELLVIDRVEAGRDRVDLEPLERAEQAWQAEQIAKGRAAEIKSTERKANKHRARTGKTQAQAMLAVLTGITAIADPVTQDAGEAA